MFGIHLCIWFVLICFVQCSEVKVITQLGEIIGERTDVAFLDDSYQVDRYLGVPYAKAPINNLRFKKPEPVERFQTPYQATTFGAICQQLDMMQWPSKFVKSEDCLFLNIYVPTQNSDQSSGHAVMFFIHGGGLTFGTGNFYPGEVLSSVGNVIVITINYRLGLFGFLDMNDERAPGNMGFLDQHQALKWVNENIEAFGGDKDRVTIFGQSAGSSSVTFQMLYSPNKGLFKNAIAESGTALMPFPLTDNSFAAAQNYAEALNCGTENKDVILECLMAMPGDKSEEILINAMTNGGFAEQMKFVVMPTLDGDFMKRSAIDLQKASLTETVEEVEFCRSINLINGVNEAEGALYLNAYGTMEELEQLEISRNQMNNEVIPGMFSMMFGFDQVLHESVKKIIIAEYTDWTGPDDPLKLRHEVVRLNGDINYNLPGVAFSLLHSNSTNAAATYMYKFTAFVDLPLVESPSWNAKANHGDELGPVFGYNLDYEEMFNKTEYMVPDWELMLSHRIMTYWSNFAKSGDPNVPSTSIQAAGPWPRYTVDDQKYMILDKEDSTGRFLFAREHNLWHQVLPDVLKALEPSQETDTCTG